MQKPGPAGRPAGPQGELQTMRFGLVGLAGYIAPRHLNAIRETGNELVAAIDPHDSVGIIDTYFPAARFFTEIERFDRHLEKLRRQGEGIQMLSVCTPNYLHDAHIRLGLRVHADVICEKPLVINPWNLDALQELEAEFGKRVYTVFQLRLIPSLVELRRRIQGWSSSRRADIELSYITRRGSWYQTSWKGDEHKSGGMAMNIGIHFFDIVQWLFGSAHETEVHLRRSDKMAGVLELEKARVRWFLSVDESDLPRSAVAAGKPAHRSMTLDGEQIEFSGNFTELHEQVYRETLAGNGWGIEDARPSVEIVYRIRTEEVTAPRDNAHPIIRGEE